MRHYISPVMGQIINIQSFQLLRPYCDLTGTSWGIYRNIYKISAFRICNISKVVKISHSIAKPTMLHVQKIYCAQCRKRHEKTCGIYFSTFPIESYGFKPLSLLSTEKKIIFIKPLSYTGLVVIGGDSARSLKLLAK